MLSQCQFLSLYKTTFYNIVIHGISMFLDVGFLKNKTWVNVNCCTHNSVFSLPVKLFTFVYVMCLCNITELLCYFASFISHPIVDLQLRAWRKKITLLEENIYRTCSKVYLKSDKASLVVKEEWIHQYSHLISIFSVKIMRVAVFSYSYI